MVIKDGAKMSKSKGNVVDPKYLIEKYGADTSRLFSLFAAPPEKDLDWSDQGVEGASRFLGRLWALIKRHEAGLTQPVPEIDDTVSLNPHAADLFRKTHQTVKKVTGDIEREYHFNTAIAALMELVNLTNSFEPSSVHDWAVLKFSIERTLLLLSPFAPHISEELWEAIGNQPSIFSQTWPGWNDEAAREEEVELVIQVNGKLRSKAMIPRGKSDEEIKELALHDSKIKEIIGTGSIRKVIAVKGKLVNIVTGGG
jgi:leucyl-tRNA synthetase